MSLEMLAKHLEINTEGARRVAREMSRPTRRCMGALASARSQGQVRNRGRP